MEGRGETRMIAESGKPLCWNLVPSVVLLYAGFRTSIPISFCVLAAGTGREDRRHGPRRVSAWLGKAEVQLKCNLILVSVLVSFSSLEQIAERNQLIRKVCFGHCIGSFQFMVIWVISLGPMVN